VVEDCLRIDAANLRRWGILRADKWNFGSIQWTNTVTGEQIADISYEIDTRQGTSGVLTLIYTIAKTQDIREPVPLETTRPPGGGVRWWFICPLSVNGVHCGRRVRVLYKPPGYPYFGCRHCYNLTYTSCQESHKWDALHRWMAEALGDLTV
jgi:hypothetical protein